MKKLVIVCFLFSFGANNVLAQSTIPGDSLIKGFHQGIKAFDKKARNCASISVIKVAIAVFGIDSVFKKIEIFPDKYVVYLRDNEIVELTKSEEATAGKYDHFGCVSTKMCKAAKFMYAVMAKRMLLQLNYEDASIKDVLEHRRGLLWLSQSTNENFHLLGLEKNYKELNSLTGIEKMNNIVIASDKHSVYSNLGFYDEYGEKINNSNYSQYHDGLKYAFVLAK